MDGETVLAIIIYIFGSLLVFSIPYLFRKFSRGINLFGGNKISKNEITKNNKYVSENKDKVEEVYKEDYKDLKPYKMRIFFSIILFIICLITVFYIKDEMYTYISVGIVIIIILVSIIQYTNKNTGKYDQIVKKILQDYDSDLIYMPNGGFTKSEYHTCLFPETCDRFYAEDMISNPEKGFYFSDILVESEHEDSDDNTYYVTEFQGSLARTNIRNIGCRIFLGSTPGKLIYGNNQFEKIKFENDEFNKLFRACSDNELISYKLLTPDIMENFVDIKKNSFGNIDIRIIYDKLYIRFLSGDTFDGKQFNKNAEKKKLLQSIAILEEVMKTMEKVKNIINDKNIE